MEAEGGGAKGGVGLGGEERGGGLFGGGTCGEGLGGRGLGGFGLQQARRVMNQSKVDVPVDLSSVHKLAGHFN